MDVNPRVIYRPSGYLNNLFSHQDYCGRTPLMVACMTGNEVAVKILVTQPEIDLETRDNEGERGEFVYLD